MDFERFHKQDFTEEGYDLYVMKNGFGNILYVGITNLVGMGTCFGMEKIYAVTALSAKKLQIICQTR